MGRGKRADIDRAMLVRMYEAGLSMPSLARRFSCSVATVWKYLALAGIERRPVGAHSRVPIPDLLALRQSGATLRQCAEAFKVSEPAVYGLCKRRGVPSPRPPGRHPVG